MAQTELHECTPYKIGPKRGHLVSCGNTSAKGQGMAMASNSVINDRNSGIAVSNPSATSTRPKLLPSAARLTTLSATSLARAPLGLRSDDGPWRILTRSTRKAPRSLGCPRGGPKRRSTRRRLRGSSVSCPLSDQLQFRPDMSTQGSESDDVLFFRRRLWLRSRISEDPTPMRPIAPTRRTSPQVQALSAHFQAMLRLMTRRAGHARAIRIIKILQIGNPTDTPKPTGPLCVRATVA